MDDAHCSPQKALVLGPVDVLGQSHFHADGQRQGTKQVASVLVMVLQPPQSVMLV